MNLTDDQAERLLGLLCEEKDECYVFMNEQEVVLATEFFDTDQEALVYARTLSKQRVNILRHVGVADNNEEIYETF